MARILPAFAFIVVYALLSCVGQQRNSGSGQHFTVDVLNGFTPVKNQGGGGVCWIYAMLAAIETEHIMRGDSVNLSPGFIVRRMLEEQYRRRVLTYGNSPVFDRATAPDLLRLVSLYGAMPFDSYSSVEGGDVPLHNTRVLARKTKNIADRAVKRSLPPSKYEPLLATMLDESLGTVPPHVYMLGAEYTAEEFGRSVCRQEEYEALTSFTHHPFGVDVDIEVPDNLNHNLFRNVPLDTLVAIVDRAVSAGHGVCWEGDISEPGFSFSRGIAKLKPGIDCSQHQRQVMFERHETTDDHCMSIVGMAHDSSNGRYYIMKNSWGTANPYGGLVYVSESYFRLKTVAVVLAKQ